MPTQMLARSSLYLVYAMAAITMAKQKAVRRIHVPMRTCIACRQTQGKRDLVRIVRTPADGVKVDLSGKLAGRGAYLCRARSCWQKALGSRLASALNTTLAPSDFAALSAFAADLPETLPDLKNEKA